MQKVIYKHFGLRVIFLLYHCHWCHVRKSNILSCAFLRVLDMDFIVNKHKLGAC
jgi:hypothetical protein